MANTKEYDSFKTKEGNEIYLYQAVNDDGEWNNLYERHPIFCPECGVAPLKFTSKTTNRCAFLSTMPIPPNKEHSRIKSKATDYEFNVLKVISVYKDGHQLQSIFLG